MEASAHWRYIAAEGLSAGVEGVEEEILVLASHKHDTTSLKSDITTQAHDAVINVPSLLQSDDDIISNNSADRNKKGNVCIKLCCWKLSEAFGVQYLTYLQVAIVPVLF